MLQFKKKNQYKFWHSPLMLGVLFCVVMVFGYNVIGLIQKEQETAKKKELTLEEIDTLRKRQTALSIDIARLKTQEGIEDTIREKYQVVKQGEKMVVIVDNKTKTEASSEQPQDHSFWSYVKKIFTRN